MIYDLTEAGWREQLAGLRRSVREASFRTAITGAGISAASGVPLIDEQIYGVPLRDFFQRRLWLETPELYFKMYRKIVESWRTALPNAAHKVLGRQDIWTISQNIDGLHRDAGAKHLLEIHGNLRELRCERCCGIYSLDLLLSAVVPKCPRCQIVLRPGIVFEGEEIRHFSLASDWVGRADLLLVIGTTLEMQPVKQLLEAARANGCTIVSINRQAEEIVPAMLEGEGGARQNGV